MDVILFLDDCRKPDQVNLPRNFLETLIITVSSYEDAISVFNNPKYNIVGLSLDYDLDIDVNESTGIIFLAKYKNKNTTNYTGMDFLNYVLGVYIRGEYPLPKKGIYVHSQNFQGAKEMKEKISEVLGISYLIPRAI